MALTVFEYLYRDAGNYQAFGKIVLLGTCSPEDAQVIVGACESQRYFIAEQVGIATLYAQLYEFSGGPTEDDHVFHEFVALRQATPDDGSVAETTVDALVDRFRNAAQRWDYTLSPHWDDGIWH